MRYVIKNKYLTVTVDTLGAEVVSVQGNDGFEYVWSGEAWRGHAPLLFPVCGSLLGDGYTVGGVEYKMPKHGFARKSEFKVENASKDEITLSLSASEETLAAYPFNFKLTARYFLTLSMLNVAFTVENLGEGVMPYMFGWHPAFNLGGGEDISSFYINFGVDGPLKRHSLQNGPFVNPESVDFPLQSGRYYLNEQEIYENDTLIIENAPNDVTLISDGERHGVQLLYSTNLPYFCIWKAPVSEARYLCLEPWSGVPADGLTPENFDTRAMSRLSGGESEIYRYAVIPKK